MTSSTETAPAKRRTRSKTAPDQIGVDAVDVARDALVEVVGAEAVGVHEEAVRESDRVVIHSFEARHRGYVGWSWKVMVARASRARVATVCDSWLEPGEGALLAPAWVPWADRLRPGDVSATDRLAYISDDDRLMQGYEATGDAETDQVALWELGLGRTRVLSEAGRTQAATRWFGGDRGPDTRAARRADHRCQACGFYLQLSGAMRQTFGVCANEWSAADGQVVAADYGCGAHSESDVEETPAVVGEPVLDESGYDVVELPDDAVDATGTDVTGAEGAAADDDETGLEAAQNEGSANGAAEDSASADADGATGENEAAEPADDVLSTEGGGAEADGSAQVTSVFAGDAGDETDADEAVAGGFAAGDAAAGTDEDAPEEDAPETEHAHVEETNADAGDGELGAGGDAVAGGAQLGEAEASDAEMTGSETAGTDAGETSAVGGSVGRSHVAPTMGVFGEQTQLVSDADAAAATDTEGHR